MKKLFGTDGIRGVANDLLTPDLALRLGLAMAHHLKPTDHPLRVLIGRDTRRSGTMFEGALASGLCSMGAQVSSVGIVPTPAVAYLVRHEHYDLGIALSASHNPAQHNGIKLIGGDGYKLPDELEAEIEAVLLAEERGYTYPPADQIGFWCVGSSEAYHDYLIQLAQTQMQDRQPLKGIRIAIDCSNGAAVRFAPGILQELGAEVHAFACEPNGDNINANCGSTHLSYLQARVLETKADVGIAFDGDADRALFCDEKGESVDGDCTMAMWALFRHAHRALNPAVVVTTEMSNFGFEKRLRAEGIRFERTRVGDRYVVERMRETNALIGGEQSGHVVFSEYATTGDGLLTMLQVLYLYRQHGKRFSEIAHPFEKTPQQLVSIPVRSKAGWDSNPVICSQSAFVSERLTDSGRLNVRPSGTEAVIRVMVEADSLDLLEDCLQTMVKTVKDEMGKHPEG